MRHYLGIDPGLSGGMVIINDDMEIVAKTVMPILEGKKKAYDLQGVRDFIMQHTPYTFIVVERQQAMPKQGISSTFKTGYGFGMLEGMFAMLQDRYITIRPNEWQKQIFIGTSEKGTKQQSASFAQKMAPQEDWTSTPRSKKAHDGMTDAFCIAWYAWRYFNGKA